MTLSTKRLRQRAFDAPASIDPVFNGSVRHADAATPLGHVQRQPVHRQQPVTARVVCLGVQCRPDAIIKRVTSVVVFALDRVVGAGLRPHIGVEILEGLKPPIADRDPASSVSFVSGIACVVAARFHALPTVILGGLAQSVSQRMLSGDGFVNTAARLSKTLLQVVGVDGFRVAAVALT
jgi:hypothetical protein